MDDHGKPTAIVEHREPRQSMSPMVHAGLEILRASPDAATLRELMEMQRQWEAHEAEKSFTVAFAAFKRDLPSVIERDSVVDYQGLKGRIFYRHLSLAGLLDHITEPLSSHGLTLTYEGSNEPNAIHVTAVLSHEAGHVRRGVTLTAPPDKGAGKNDVQAIASTVTMLQRHAAQLLLGLGTRDAKEPEGAAEPPEPDSDATINSKRNLTCVGWLKGMGKSCEDAAKHLGKPIERWTQSDRNALRKWAEPPKDEELT